MESKALKAKKRDTVIYLVASILFFIIGIVLAVVDTNGATVEIAIISFVVSVICFIVHRVFRKMTVEEYKKCSTTSNSYVYDNGIEVLRCPECGSTHLVYKPKKFSKGKAMLGIALTGRCYGALFGVPTGNECKTYCKECGKRFTVIEK